MKQIITYAPLHREVLVHAIHLALSWHEGKIEPIQAVMLNAFKRHHTGVVDLELTSQQIRETLMAIRQIDTDGEAFGKHEVLASIKLSESGETVLTDQEVLALESLSEFVTRLMIGQTENCFDWCHIRHIDDNAHEELKRLAMHLHIFCWNMEHYASYGIRYSEESDTLWDVYQVLRHERYLNFSEKDKELMRCSVMAGEAMQTAREQLIKIKTIIENDE